MPIESSLLQSNRLVLLHCHHFLDRHPGHPLLDFVYRILGNFAEMLSGSMMQ